MQAQSCVLAAATASKMEGRGHLMDCLRAGRRAARCRRTLGTGSPVSSKQLSKKYDLKNLCSQKKHMLTVFNRDLLTPEDINL